MTRMHLTLTVAILERLADRVIAIERFTHAPVPERDDLMLLIDALTGRRDPGLTILNRP